MTENTEQNTDENTPEVESPATPQPNKNTDLSFSAGFSNFLASVPMSLAVSSYQSGGLYLFGSTPDAKLTMHQAQFPHAMGVVGDAQRIYLGTLAEVVRLENVLNPGQVANNVHDKVYVPRNHQVVGGVDIHELGIQSDGVIVFVNTRFSCLCHPSVTHSFKPIWKPHFISKLAPEDRCHLNGLAMKDGAPAYVSAICKSDVIDGWRDRRHDGGIVMDVAKNEIVVDGLSMPHSPRWHNDQLWVLNSGTGELGTVDIDAGTFNPVAFFPGFMRGLSFIGNYAIVTLSKPRYKRFDGLALADKLEEKDADAWCGVQILDLTTGDVVHWIRFDGHIGELFDVTVLPGTKSALTVGPHSPEIREFITYEPLQEAEGLVAT